MHLVGFIIRTYHDARSPERQIRYDSYVYREWRNYVTTYSKRSSLVSSSNWNVQHNLGQYYQTHTSVNYVTTYSKRSSLASSSNWNVKHNLGQYYQTHTSVKFNRSFLFLFSAGVLSQHLEQFYN